MKFNKQDKFAGQIRHCFQAKHFLQVPKKQFNASIMSLTHIICLLQTNIFYKVQSQYSGVFRRNIVRFNLTFGLLLFDFCCPIFGDFDYKKIFSNGYILCQVRLYEHAKFEKRSLQSCVSQVRAWYNITAWCSQHVNLVMLSQFFLFFFTVKTMYS